MQPQKQYPIKGTARNFKLLMKQVKVCQGTLLQQYVTIVQSPGGDMDVSFFFFFLSHTPFI